VPVCRRHESDTKSDTPLLSWLQATERQDVAAENAALAMRCCHRKRSPGFGVRGREMEWNE